MIATETKGAFEVMAEAGTGDPGALAIGLRRSITGVGLRALAAKAVHVAAAAPERMVDIYDNAAAGWTSGPVFPPRLRNPEPLPISRGFWKAFWAMVNLPPNTPGNVFAERALKLAAKLDPRINDRMAAAALAYPGVAEAAAGGIPDRYDLEALADCSPASLGYAVRQEALIAPGLTDPFWKIVPLLREMPPPLDYVNVQVIQSLVPLGLVAGYRPAWLDQVALGGFMMGQVGHHYSALTTAVVLTAISFQRPAGLEVILDCIFRGWLHGRETPPLIGVPWERMWDLRIDQVREALQVVPFESPYLAALQQLGRQEQRPGG